jgi:hypothetical protein
MTMGLYHTGFHHGGPDTTLEVYVLDMVLSHPRRMALSMHWYFVEE